jgi:hypothetical protein
VRGGPGCRGWLLGLAAGAGCWGWGWAWAAAAPAATAPANLPPAPALHVQVFKAEEGKQPQLVHSYGPGRCARRAGAGLAAPAQA